VRDVASDQPVDTRTELLSLLSDACELEHSLACSYLYAAFSLKQDLSEGGLDWRQLQQVRLWAAQIYFVASQEMLHLAQAWNLLAAVGGTPYYMRPPFPQDGTSVHIGTISLEPFSLSTVRRFAHFERPGDLAPQTLRALPHFAAGNDDGDEPSFEYNRVGELYRLIRSGFDTIPEPDLFIGKPDRQIGPALVDFPAIVPVIDRDSARRAIDMITTQGEGIPADTVDCHFGIYKTIIADLGTAIAADPAFRPARNSIGNPILERTSERGQSSNHNLIVDDYTASVAAHFDSVYVLMLRLLQHVFDNATSSPKLLRLFSRLAIELMVRVIKPLGESLTLLPSGIDDRTAGAPFRLDRHVPLPIEPKAASVVAGERLLGIAQGLSELSADQRAPRQLLAASNNLAELAARSRAATARRGPRPIVNLGGDISHGH
jgi:hypothetical protein